MLREHIPDDFQMINENRGEMLTFGQTVDEFEAAAAAAGALDNGNAAGANAPPPQQKQQQQHQQIAINNNVIVWNFHRNAAAQQPQPPLMLFLRRRPITGPLLPVDMTPFDRLPLPILRNQHVGIGNQPQQPQNRMPMMIIDYK